MMPNIDPPRDNMLGQTIVGRYRIISRLGSGGMGVAYRAWDKQAGRPVVIKFPKQAFLLDSPEFRERFSREICIHESLCHPHVVPMVARGQHEQRPFYVMRFLPGGSLTDRRLRDDGGTFRPNPPGMLCLWLPAAAAALDFVHARGIVHRDIKPANFFFDASWRPYLGDFGIAKIIGQRDSFDLKGTLSAASVGIGTPAYMAPEQFQDIVEETPEKPVLDGRTDQYALAVLVYEMLTATRPFIGSTADIIINKLLSSDKPAPPLTHHRRDLPSSLVQAVERAILYQRDNRFPSCAAFAAAALRDVPPLDPESHLARLLCPHCGNLLKLPIAAVGRTGKCPRCRTEMTVADDLGALWLPDEACRREEDDTVFDVDGNPDFVFFFGEPVAGGSPTDSKLFFGTSGISRIVRRVRKSLPNWINRHDLIVTAVLGLFAVVPWIILAVVVSENQRLKDRVLALEKNSPNPKQRDIGP